MFSRNIVPAPHNDSLWAVAWVSFLLSASSLMVFSLFPTFLKDELQMTGSYIGQMEGLAIFLSFSVRLFSGIWSDHVHSRKPFIFAGALFSTLIKPAFALITSPFMACSVRILDRTSKGIRAAPFDALVSDLSPRENRGAAFGLRQSFKTLGVIVGGILASLCMHFSSNNYRFTFLMASIPAALSMILIFKIKQPPFKKEASDDRKKEIWRFSEIKDLPKEYWQTLVFCLFLFGAYFSEFFITLHLKETGISLTWLPLLVVSINIVHAASAFPFGKISDRISHGKMLIFGVLLLILVDLVFAFSSTLPMLFLGVFLIGMHMGVTRGLVRATLSEHVPSHLRGTAYAVFYFLTGFSLWGANCTAGWFSDRYGSSGPFLAGAVFASIALCILVRNIRQGKTN
jgi:MFS family permease